MDEFDAKEIVAGVLAPLPLETFLADYRNRLPCHIKGEAGRFAELFGWERLSRALEFTPLDPARLELARNKRLKPESYGKATREGWRPVPGKVLMQLRAGATLVLNDIHKSDAQVAHLCDALGEAFDSIAGANVYAAWKKVPSFGLHWDDHDVIVIQVAGNKHWRVHAPTVPDPLDEASTPEPAEGAEPFWSGTLEDGDVLYLPRGWWHLVEAVEGPSLHLTLSLSRPTAVDYLKWLAKDLRGDARLRADIPQFGDDGEAAEAWLERFRGIVSEAADANSLAAFVASHLARPPRLEFAFPALDDIPSSDWQPDTRLQLLSDSRLVLREHNGTASIIDGNATIPCQPEIVPALRRLAGHKSIPLSEMEALVPESARPILRMTLDMLSGFGLLAAR